MGNKLLLADDSITIQKVVAIIFANEEFELTVVDNGIAALEKAREVRPDVMLVDALMPGKSGYEVCAELRRDPLLSATPILLLIGAFEPFDEEKARECGADSSITKPFESQQLIDRVKELLILGQNRPAPSAPAAAAAPAAPAAAAVPIESAAAEELWGDLSSFDTMPPVSAPAAPTPSEAENFFNAPAAVEPAPVVPAAPAAPEAALAAAPQAPAAAVQPAEAIQEASLEDDLWGAFELEEVPAAAAPAAVAADVEPEFEAEEFFSFEEDDAIEETGPALDIDAAVAAELQASPEELFSCAEEEPEAVEPVAQPDPFNFPVEEPFSFEPEAIPEVAAQAPLAAEPLVAAAAAASAPVFEAPVSPAQPVAQPASAAQPAAISEADLIAALSKVSREVIERIVWEVVPDLADVLIKEEIRKLKAGIKG